MAFSRPTLSRLIARAKSDIETRLPGADAQVRRTIEYVLARVVAGLAHSLHGHLVWNSKQLMPDTATDELMVRWADIWGLSRNAATNATGNVAITGVNTTVCPDQTLWQDANGVVYVQDGAQTIALGVATIVVDAQDGGSDGNQAAGAVLSLVTPITGIDTDGTVDGSGLAGGADQETLAALLDRLLLLLRSPPKGGGPGDYITWALEVAGTTRAWQLANASGLGTVSVWYVEDDNEVSIIPNAASLATMQAYLDSKAPVTADVSALAPTSTALTMSVTLVPNTAAVQAAATALLEDLVKDTASPHEATTLLLSHINEAISLAAGETDHTITLVNGGAPADVAYTVGQIPTLSTITWS